MKGTAHTQTRRRTLRALLAFVLTVAVPVGLLGVDSAWTAATSPERRTTVVEVSRGFTDAKTFDPTVSTVFLNGLGLDVSREQAEALTPSVGRYGRVLALEYAAVFHPDSAADALYRLIRPSPDARRPAHLTVVASSMGDVRGLEIIASMQQRHPDVSVIGFVVVTGPGPGKRTRVRGQAAQALIDRSCTPFVPGRVTMGAVEVFNQLLQQNVTDADTAAIAFRSGTAYPGRVVVNQLCSLTRPTAIEEPPWIPFSVYLGVGSPDDDVVVDTEGAYRDWRRLLPGMEIRRVQGATHDNLHFRPDLFNALFASDLLPRIRLQQVVRSPMVGSGVRSTGGQLPG